MVLRVFERNHRSRASFSFAPRQGCRTLSVFATRFQSPDATIFIFSSAATFSFKPLKRSGRKWLIAGVFLSLVILLIVPFLMAGTNHPRLEITLISPPKPEAPQKAFQVYNPPKRRTTNGLPRIAIAWSFEFKNLGPGSIVFPYRGMFSAQIQRTNSTEWIGANQIELGWRPPPLRSAASQEYGVRIPADAASLKSASSPQIRCSRVATTESTGLWKVTESPNRFSCIAAP